MTKSLSTIYKTLQDDLEFVRRNGSNKKRIRGLSEASKSAVLNSFIYLVAGNNKGAYSAFRIISFDVALERLQIVYYGVLECRKVYVGHATEVRHLVADFDSIEPAIIETGKFLDNIAGLDIQKKIARRSQLRRVLKSLEACYNNLMERRELWEKEVGAHKTNSWVNLFLWPVVAGLVVAAIAYCCSVVFGMYFNGSKDVNRPALQCDAEK